MLGVKKPLKIKLGNRYRDTIHGFEGVAISQTTYIAGCDRVCLEFMKDGEIKASYFDITQLEGVKITPKQNKPGGPRPVPPART